MYRFIIRVIKEKVIKKAQGFFYLSYRLLSRKLRRNFLYPSKVLILQDYSIMLRNKQ